jgi:hypothetical protein
LGKGSVEDCNEHGNEPSGVIRGGEFRDQLSHHQSPTNDSAALKVVGDLMKVERILNKSLARRRQYNMMMLPLGFE